MLDHPRRYGPAGVSGAGAVLLAYLVVTFPALLAAGPNPAVAVGHLAMLAGVATLELRRRRPAPRSALERVLADWHFLLLLPLLYAELPWLMLGEGYRDAAVVALDAFLFGGRPAFDWAGAWPQAWISEPLHAAYLAYYPVIYVPPLLLYLRGWRGAPPTGGGVRSSLSVFAEVVTGLAVSMLACYLVFVVLPVQGPRYVGTPAGVPDGPVRSVVLLVLQSGSSRGAAFPSSHVAVAVTQTVLALRHQPRVGGVLAVVTPLLAAGAVYGGFHYASDVAAGLLVGLVAAALARPLQDAVRRRTDGAVPGFTSPGDDV